MMTVCTHHPLLLYNHECRVCAMTTFMLCQKQLGLKALFKHLNEKIFSLLPRNIHPHVHEEKADRNAYIKTIQPDFDSLPLDVHRMFAWRDKHKVWRLVTEYRSKRTFTTWGFEIREMMHWQAENTLIRLGGQTTPVVGYRARHYRALLLNHLIKIGQTWSDD